MIAFDHETFETYIPTRQRSAREQAAQGVMIPYWIEDMDGPVTYHVKIMLLTPDELDRLVIFCRKQAAEFRPNPLDNRGDNLDYTPTNRERVDVLRHICLNRTEKNSGLLAGYHSSFDNLLHRIEKKGIDVARRQLELRRHVLALIAEHYPHLKTECEYQLFLKESGLQKERKQ